jgi:biopolymer transport protein ExbB
MRIPLIALAVLLSSIELHAKGTDVLGAFQREQVFLKTQIEDLKKLKVLQERKYKESIAQVNSAMKAHRQSLVDLAVQNEKLEQEFSALESQRQNGTDNILALEAVIQRSRTEMGLTELSEEGVSPLIVEQTFDAVLDDLEKSASVITTRESFFDSEGKLTEGKVVHIGSVASVLQSEGGFALLAPAGNGKLKIWGETFSNELFSGPQQSLYLYESRSQEAVLSKDKSVLEFLQAGGTIAWVIVSLGAFALLLCLLRFLNLRSYDTEIQRASLFVQKKVTDFEEFLDTHRRHFGVGDFFLRIRKAALHKKDSEEIDCLVEEGIIEESRSIDRFGSMILVFAAVAPLLGLLGTVTGMISTFEVITEFGTGDPKLLSQGISEALITTELGLIVAIPLLLLGHLLSNWGRGMKQKLEQAILGFSRETQDAL